MSWEKMGLSKEKGGLGFRDLTLFNKALLAKQGWLLMKNPDSLIARILKAKYYPNSSFLDSSLGSRPSFAWRSIYAAKDLLHQRLIWRVGDRHSIKILGDRWIPTPTSFMVQSPMMGTTFNFDSTVDSLMDRRIGGWNVALIRSTFSAKEADVISKIHICPSFPLDCLVWQGTKNGSFSVHSAYHLGKLLQQRTLGECSSLANYSDIWKVIWSLRVPNLVKVFMWRACHNLLPTNLYLFKQKVVDSNLCPCCEKEETIIHALWKCPSAQDVWDCKESFLKKCHTRRGFFDLLVEAFLPRLSPDNLTLLAMVARSILHRRNSLVFEGKFKHSNDVFSETTKALEEFSQCNSVFRPPDRVAEGAADSWLPPPSGSVKINWDAALNKNMGFIGLGCVARDWMGNFLGAKCTFQQTMVEPKMAKAISAIQAIHFAITEGFSDVVFEGDSLQLIQDINSASPLLSSTGHYVDSIKHLQMVFNLSKFAHCKREANGVAHLLAKEAAIHFIDCTWTESPPSMICNLLCRERFSP
jgi:hypothetical protein